MAAAAVVFLIVPEPSRVVAFMALAVATLIAFALGRALGFRHPPRPIDVDHLAPATGPDPKAVHEAGFHSEQAPKRSHGAFTIVSNPGFVSFVQEVIASTDNESLRSTLEKHLPTMVGSRLVWITSHLDNRRQVIVSTGRNAPPLAFLDADGQEWTTFPLRVEHKLIGVLGVDSSVTLAPELKEFLQIIAPVIAQSIHTAHVIEGLREAGLVDLLTGTATRREGLNRLRAEMKRSQRTGDSMAVLMLDLDRFKSINDRFGHGSGDALLTAIGKTTETTLRASDIRSRWGGEEFLIVLPDTDLTRAQVVAAGLLHNIATTLVPTPSGVVSTSVSIGLTICRAGETDVDAVIRRADMALYRAKEAGRGCVRVVLGDRDSNPIGVGTRPQPPRTPPSTTLPFPDRRNPLAADRHGVPNPGRRSTDAPRSGPFSTEHGFITAERQAHTTLP